MQKQLSQLRGMRSAMLPDPVTMKTPEDFNRRIDSLIETLNSIRIQPEEEASTEVEVEPAPKKKRKSKVQIDLGMDRMESGGDVREGDE